MGSTHLPSSQLSPRNNLNHHTPPQNANTNNMSDKNTSTLQSYIDSASGAAQSALGSLIGSNADKTAGENKKAEADLKNDASHAGANIGGYSVSASGVAQNDPNRSAGSWNQPLGSGKETLGNLLG